MLISKGHFSGSLYFYLSHTLDRQIKINVFIYFRRCPEGCKEHFAIHPRAQRSWQRCVALGQGTGKHGIGSFGKCLFQGWLGLLRSCPGTIVPQGGRGRLRPSLQGSCAGTGGGTLLGRRLIPTGSGEVNSKDKPGSCNLSRTRAYCCLSF